MGEKNSLKEQAAEIFGEGGKAEVEIGRENLWVEIRIPARSEHQRLNLEPIFRWMHNEAETEGDVFEFVIIGTEPDEEEMEGLRTRYFVKAPDYRRKRDLWNRLEGVGFSPHEVPEPLDFSRYERRVRYEMNDDFAIPLVPSGRFESGNFPQTPNQLASAVKDGGALRIAVRKDRDAENHIQKFINQEEGKSADPLSVVEGLLDNLVFGRTHDGTTETKGEKRSEEEETKYSRLARERKDENHVNCEFRAYGNDAQTRRISKSFGFELNDIVEHRQGEPKSNRSEIKNRIKSKLGEAFNLLETAAGKEEDIRETLDKPGGLEAEEDRKNLNSTLTETSENLNDASEAMEEASEILEDYREDEIIPDRRTKKNVLKILIILPLLLPVPLACLGMWNPHSMLNFSSVTGFLIAVWPVLASAGLTAGLWLWFFGRAGNPIVLTVRELAMIGSIPTRAETLPVQFVTQPMPTGGQKEGEPGESEGEEEATDEKEQD